MRIYEANKLHIIKLGVKHPAINELKDKKMNCWSSLQTGILKLSGKKATTCPVQYRYSKLAELENKPFPIMSVIGVSEFDDHILVGLRSKKVRFPNVMCAAPTGHVEFGLTPDDAMKMELKEELGVKGKQKLMGVQLSPLYLGLIYQIKLESNEVSPSWEWSNLIWIQEEKVGEFLMKRGGAFGPGFASSLLLYLHKKGEDIEPIVEQNKWDLKVNELKGLNWKLNRSPEISQ